VNSLALALGAAARGREFFAALKCEAARLASGRFDDETFTVVLGTALDRREVSGNITLPDPDHLGNLVCSERHTAKRLPNGLPKRLAPGRRPFIPRRHQTKSLGDLGVSWRRGG